MSGGGNQPPAPPPKPKKKKPLPFVIVDTYEESDLERQCKKVAEDIALELDLIFPKTPSTSPTPQVTSQSSAPSTSTSAKMSKPTKESVEKLLVLKEKRFDKLFVKFKSNIESKQPEVESIEVDFNILSDARWELVSSQETLLTFFLEENNSKAYELLQEKQDDTKRRFLMVEAKMKAIMKERGQNTEPNTPTSPTTTVKEQAEEMAKKLFTLRETALNQVAYQMNVLSPLIIAEDLEQIISEMDNLTVHWEQFEKIDSNFFEHFNSYATPNEIHTESLKKVALMQQKKKLEREVEAIQKEAQKKLDAELPDPSLERYALQHRKHLPKLASSVLEWLPFWAHFQEIDSHPRMTDVRKMQELIQATEEGSEARETVTGFATAGKSYAAVIAYLKEMYGRQNVHVKVYVNGLLQMAVDKSLGKSLEFRKLVNRITSYISNLSMLGLIEDNGAKVLYPLVEACLPNNVLAKYQQTLPLNAPDDLDNLIKFLQEEVIHGIERQHAQFKLDKDKSSSNGNAKKVENKSKGSTSTATSFHNSSSSSCIFCGEDHYSNRCKSLRGMSWEKRDAIVKSKGACFVCLEVGHTSKECPKKDIIKCSKCGKKHCRIMCRQPTEKTGSEDSKDNQQQQDNADSSAPPKDSVGLKNNIESPDVPLQILTLIAEGINGKTKFVRAMIDTGSQKSYVLRSVQEELQFKHIGEEKVIHKLFGGVTTSLQQHEIVEIRLRGARGQRPHHFGVSCLPAISDDIQSSPPGPWLEEFKKFGVTFEPASTSETIDVLIGNDVAPRLYTGKIVDLGTGPVAMETKWGWVLSGKLPQQSCQKVSGNMVNITNTLMDLPVSALWDLDNLGIQDAATKLNKEDLALQTQQHFTNTVKVNKERRYEVQLPFLDGAKDLLPTNYYAAERRLRSTTQNIQKQGFIQQYGALFRQWELDGMIEEVTKTDNQNIGHYLPHQAVIKLTSETTPIRPVFDASAKAKGKPSLNNCLEKGPNLLELIPSLLTRFRIEKVGITADIKKAFQQISVAEEHRNYLKFLWWADEACTTIKVYRHTRVVFGVSSSPFLLGATLNHHLDLSPLTHKETAIKVKTSFYVDNLVTSVPSESAADKLELESQQLLQPAMFDLRGWERGPNKSGGKIISILGLKWDTGKDILSYDLKAAMEKVGAGNTQRGIISLAHMLFDPLGVLAPFIIIAKLVLRKSHQLKLGWDKALPKELQEEFDKWSQQIPTLVKLKFDRFSFWSTAQQRSLHVFGDASGEAYAAVVYLRAETTTGVVVSLIQAKSKVAPKNATIPRLELLGCLIGCRLSQAVQEDLRSPTIPTTFWTDSTTALTWITGDGPWSIFVNNRVEEIRKNTDISQWKHVPGKQNPADLPSRGCSASKLVDSQWWKGPAWLYQTQEFWPRMVGEIDQDAVAKERKKTVVTNTVTTTKSVMDDFLRIADYPRTLHAVARWSRVKQNLLHRVTRKTNHNPVPVQMTSDLTEDELEHAEVLIIRHSQRHLQLTSKRVQKLRPFKDNQGLWRTRTRLLEAEEISINPIILPEDEEFARRLIKSLHDKTSHIGTQLLLAKTRERFWLINGRRNCRKIIKACWICNRFNSKRVEVEQAPLPVLRTGTGQPWERIGVDMTGPLITTDKKKVWIALFTCASYRAVHMEIVEEMTTKAFFKAFRMFAGRRGKPKVVYSDNGLNFTGANAAFQCVYKKHAHLFAQEERIDWRFSVPAAPWWGGFYERLIGLTKSLLRKQLGKRAVTKSEVEVLLVDVEEALNNRPLTYQSEDPDDLVPLTPNLLVRNSGLGYVPELDIRDGTSARAAVKRVQRIREGLRSRFRKEYLGQLRFEGKKRNTEPQLKVGDVVLVEKDSVKRQFWPIGRIIGAIPGRDGVNRMFKLKMKGGVLERAAQRLFPMELGEEVEAQQQG